MNISIQTEIGHAYVNVWVGLDDKIVQVRDFSVPDVGMNDGIVNYSGILIAEHKDDPQYEFLNHLKTISVGEDINFIVNRLLSEFPELNICNLGLISL
jgi:hypothetical protein